MERVTFSTDSKTTVVFPQFPLCLTSLKCFWFYYVFLFSNSVCSPHGNSLVLIKISGILPWHIIYYGTVYLFSYLGNRCVGLDLKTPFFSELSKNQWRGMRQQKWNHVQQTKIHSRCNSQATPFVLVTCRKCGLTVFSIVKYWFVPNCFWCFIVIHVAKVMEKLCYYSQRSSY